MRFKSYSFRFAEQVLNSKLALKQEIEGIVQAIQPNKSLSRPRFNQLLKRDFIAKGWEDQPLVFNEPGDPTAKMVF